MSSNMIYFLFFIVALALSSFGQGGGVLFTPLLLLFGHDIYTASTISLFLIIFLSASSSVVFIKEKRVNWKLVFILELFTMPFSFLGGYLANFCLENILIIILITVLTASGVLIIFNCNRDNCRKINRKRFYHLTSSYQGQEYQVNLGLALLVSAAAGFFAGMLGIGGGVLKTPFMHLILGIPLPVAIGCSALMVGFTALTGLAGHLSVSSLPLNQAVGLAVLVVLGASIGPRLSVKLKVKPLKFIYGILLLVVALVVVVKNFLL